MHRCSARRPTAPAHAPLSATAPAAPRLGCPWPCAPASHAVQTAVRRKARRRPAATSPPGPANRPGPSGTALGRSTTVAPFQTSSWSSISSILALADACGLGDLAQLLLRHRADERQRQVQVRCPDPSLAPAGQRSASCAATPLQCAWPLSATGRRTGEGMPRSRLVQLSWNAHHAHPLADRSARLPVADDRPVPVLRLSR